MTRMFVALAAMAMVSWGGPGASAESASVRLTTADVYIALQAAEAKANEIGVPMGITVTDAHGTVRGFIKMDGTFVHAQDTSFSKAYSAVSLRQPTGGLPPSVAHELGSITQGRLTNLKGGHPGLLHRHIYAHPFTAFSAMVKGQKKGVGHVVAHGMVHVVAAGAG